MTSWEKIRDLIPTVVIFSVIEAYKWPWWLKLPMLLVFGATLELYGKARYLDGKLKAQAEYLKRLDRLMRGEPPDPPFSRPATRTN